MSRKVFGTLGPNFYLQYNGALEKLFRESSLMEDVSTSPTSASVGHEYVQHPGSEWHGEHCIWYQSSMIPESSKQMDAVACICEKTTALQLSTAAVFSQRGQQKEDSDGATAILNRLNEKLGCEKSRFKLSAFVVEAGNALQNK